MKKAQATGNLKNETTQVTSSPVFRRRFVFRCVALFVVPLLAVLLLECGLRLSGVGYTAGFLRKQTIQGKEVWTENPEFGRRFFPPGLVRYPRPFAFPSQKGTNTLRIFVLGESAAMGDPDYKFGLPRMLEVLLRERFPERRIEVVNAAMVAINSHVILPIARDCAAREADLWVIFMGNNEVIGPFGSASVFGAAAPPLPLVRAGLWLRTTRIGQLAAAALHRARAGSGPPPEWTGMQMMASQRAAATSPETLRVHRHFARNLADILAAARRGHVSALLCTVPTNLRDCAPFASLHRQGLSAKELAEWERSYSAGAAAQGATNGMGALSAYESAWKIDAEFADLAYRMAQCHLMMGNSREAAEYFGRARDLDALQFRTDSRLNNSIRQAAGVAGEAVKLFDAEKLFAEQATGGVPGAEYFYEHVHLTPEGNYLLARALAERIREQMLSGGPGDWVSESECLRLLGFSAANRYAALETMRDRMESPPFTAQIGHEEQLRKLQAEIVRARPKPKPAQVRHEIQQSAELLRRHPEDVDLRCNYAVVLEAGGDLAAAEEQWRAVLKQQPQAALARVSLGKLLERLGRDPEALQSYAAALEINPDYSPVRQALGLVALRVGQSDLAVRCLETVVSQRPDDVGARLALGRAYARASRPREAEAQFREILRREPDNAAVHEELRLLGRSG